MFNALTASDNVNTHYITQFDDNKLIHTVARCKLEIKFTVHLATSHVQVNSSAHRLLQQQEQRSDASNTVYHSLQTSQTE